MTQELSAKDQETLIQNGWSIDGGTASKTFRFKDFTQAFGFMTQCALCAEKLDHHPDWSNSYNKVMVSLTSHDAGGLTKLDLSLAEMMDQISRSAISV